VRNLASASKSAAKIKEKGPSAKSYGAFFKQMKKIDYTLIRSHRRTLCLEIRDGALIVRSPYLVTRWAVESFIKSKQSWIAKKLKQTKDKRAQHRFIAGERFLFLGKKQDLGIYQKEQLKEFYKEQTGKIIPRIIKKYARAFTIKDKIKIKFYKSKWGSCTSRGHLSFNAVLAMTPIEVIEYVVIHELVHTKVKSHSKHFWQLVQHYDSGYKKKRKWLRVNKHNLSL